MRRIGVFGLAVFIVAWQAAVAAPAGAADLAPDYLPPAPVMAPEAPASFGSGWYLRGDAAVNFDDLPKLDTANFAPSFAKSDDVLGYGVGVGAGYKLNSFLRFDVTGDFLDPYSYAGLVSCGPQCGEQLKTKIWRWDGLANAYVDLGTWGGLTPYIGAGAGFSGVRQDGSVAYNGGPVIAPLVDPATGLDVYNAKLPSHTRYQFAWAGMAGFSYAFAPHMLLDVGYRYLDLGKTTIQLYPATSVSKDLSTQQVRVGIRYIID